LRVSLEWLAELVDFDESAETLAEMLSFSGTKVEGIEKPGSELHGLVVAEVVQILDHPNADNLSLVDVSLGDGTQRLVCGASNFAVGDKVPLARVGARLKDFQIGARKIRGQVSEGMLCSAAELGIGKDHSGILIMPPDTEVGQDLVQALGLDDVILRLELTLNRPDCTGMIGIAREVAALVGSRLRLPDASVHEDDGLASPVSVTIADPTGCTRYVARYLENAEPRLAPQWMQSRLLKAGMRTINSVVDATNYVLLETGHPLHAFDATLVADRSIEVRRAASGEPVRTLDGVDRKMETEDLLIADGGKVLAIAGVMGSENSEVGDHTTEIILESAHFDPASVAFTSRRHSLRTEASSRFEKGADPEMAPFAAARAARIMARTAGARVSEPTRAAPRIVEAATHARPPWG
jgi:phenylalanyl-tRNA synthetase beta chain